MTTLVSSDGWRQQHVDHISDSLQEFISDKGATQAREAICDAIMTWVDYHQQELNKWSELARMLNLPVGTPPVIGSQVQRSQSFNTPLQITENNL